MTTKATAAVASISTERWVAGFFAKLSEAQIPQNQFSFWELWVKQFIQYCKTEGLHEEDKASSEAFFELQIKKGRKIWQVEQARRALHLYGQLKDRKLNNDLKNEITLNSINGDSDTIAKPGQIKSGTGIEAWNLLVQKVASAIKMKHYAANTLNHYTTWTRRFGVYCKYKNPDTLHVSDVRMYLEYLAVNRNVSSSHQNQAFNALLFLFRHVLHMPFEGLGSTIRAKEIKTLPEILSSEELDKLFNSLQGPFKLITELLYGCGFRLEEGLTLRIKDIDFSRNIIILRQGKGKKDRVLPLPQLILQRLKNHIQQVRHTYENDMKNDVFNGVFLPESFQNKKTSCAKEWGWYWLFPARELTHVKEEHGYRRYHIHETTYQRALQRAASEAQITKHVKSHMLRHTFSTDLLDAGYDIRQIQDLLGHTDVRTTMIYTHVVRPDAKPVKSPLDIRKERG